MGVLSIYGIVAIFRITKIFSSTCLCTAFKYMWWSTADVDSCSVEPLNDPHKRRMGVSLPNTSLSTTVADFVAFERFTIWVWTPNWKTTQSKSPRGVRNRIQGLKVSVVEISPPPQSFSVPSRDFRANVFLVDFEFRDRIKSRHLHQLALCIQRKFLQITKPHHIATASAYGRKAICSSTNPCLPSTNHNSQPWKTW
jgi:hypothetical protein